MMYSISLPEFIPYCACCIWRKMYSLTIPESNQYCTSDTWCTLWLYLSQSVLYIWHLMYSMTSSKSLRTVHLTLYVLYDFTWVQSVVYIWHLLYSMSPCSSNGQKRKFVSFTVEQNNIFFLPLSKQPIPRNTKYLSLLVIRVPVGGKRQLLRIWLRNCRQTILFSGVMS